MLRGDYVIVSPTPADQLRGGDIIIVRQEAGFLTHRLVHRDGDDWITQGERCSLLDPPVPATAIAGWVVAVKREEQRIDLQAPHRRLPNRVRGWLGYAIARWLAQAGKRLKSLSEKSLLGKRTRW